MKKALGNSKEVPNFTLSKNFYGMFFVLFVISCFNIEFNNFSCMVPMDFYGITFGCSLLLINIFFVFYRFHNRSMTKKLCGPLAHW